MWILFILAAHMVLPIFTPLPNIVHDWLSLEGGRKHHNFCGSCCITGASGQRYPRVFSKSLFSLNFMRREHGKRSW